MNTSPQEKICAHPSCSCPVEPGSNYCSEACQAIGENDTGNCPCTHDACLEAQATQKQPVAPGFSKASRQENQTLRQGVSGSYDPKTQRQDRGKPLADDWGKSDKH